MSQRRRRLTPEQRNRIMKKRRMQRFKKRLMIIVPVALVLIVVLILLLGGKKSDEVSQNELTLQTEPTAETAVDGTIDKGIEGTETAETEVQASPTPSPTPTVDPQATAFDYDEAYAKAATGEVTGPDVGYELTGVDADKADRWPEVEEGYIPIIYSANTTENIIAVTVDDCFQGSNFRTIVQCAIDNSAKLTIFPIGENLERDSVAEALRLAYQNGMEIGNHTYTHSGLFHYDQNRMSSEIWSQIQKVNEVLGVNYTQHFFRPRGGDERTCQRLHAYLNQLGYKGMAIWSMSGSSSSLDELYNDLAPGRVYLFHTTDKDLNTLLQFIPGAISRGYRLVTLSEMFGLEENEVSEYKAETTVPELQSFKIIPKTLVKNNYNRATEIMQQRLIDLGWMGGTADGVYGQQSVLAVGFAQMAMEQTPTGKADTEFQSVLFSDDAPTGSLEQIQAYCRQLGKSELKQLPGSDSSSD